MPVCTDFIEPLNLRCLLINTFAERNDIFLGVAFILLASLAAYFKMSNLVFFALFGLFLIMTSAFLNTTQFLFLFIVVGGIIFYVIKSKPWKS